LKWIEMWWKWCKNYRWNGETGGKWKQILKQILKQIRFPSWNPWGSSARLPRLPRTASGHGCHGCHGSRFGERRGRWLRPRQHRSIDGHTWFGNDMEMTWIRLVWRCLKISKNDQTCIYWCILYTAVYYTYIYIYIYSYNMYHMISHDQMMYSSSYAHVAAMLGRTVECVLKCIVSRSRFCSGGLNLWPCKLAVPGKTI
jgi:hypothetical protein